MRRFMFVCIALGLWACSPTPAPSTSASPSQAEAASCTEPCPSAASTSGPFKLELALPKTDWKSDEPITGTATLSYGGPDAKTLYGSGGLLDFQYTQVGGPHKTSPASRAECGRYEIRPGMPMSTQLSKSGGFTDDDPDAAWLRSFLTAPDVRLSAGTWDVTALANFREGDCGPGGESMATTVRVTVTD
jgi:hypothetical protein